MEQRNRSEGWEYAKKTGHDNERLVAELTRSDPSIQQRILSCVHLENEQIIRVEYGGICEKNVECIFSGENTKSKTDMWLVLESGKHINVSVKKDNKGQAFLVSIDRFIRGFELQYNEKIPYKVKRALELYFGSAEDIPEIINKYATNNISLQVRKHRLVASTLKAYDDELANLLLSWINEHIQELFDYCFARGLAKSSADWAHIIWYKNMLGEYNFDEMINIAEAKTAFSSSAVYGPRNGGSTIQLPFGFIEWHSPRKTIPGNIQFHHKYDKIINALK
ncbi:MAG: hypothetical protein IJ298_04805 [Ruminococcus sp.]|nr:hypothetical protein [Ruminococcus sp.]